MTEYSVGQVWEYETRIGEAESRLYIVKIDHHEKLGNIYHIYVDSLKMENPHIEGGVQTALPHAPVDQETLEGSLVSLVEDIDTLPDISEGYNVWKEAFDSGDGGVFNIPVSKIIEYIEDVIKH